MGSREEVRLFRLCWLPILRSPEGVRYKVKRTGKGENGERGREDNQELGRALVANSLCRGQGKHTMLHEQEVQIGNPGLGP
jgi:hypothetical protein